MEHPVTEIAGVIRTLTEGNSDQQRITLAEYFLPNASFSHHSRLAPCSKGSPHQNGGIESLGLAIVMYQWYRTLSPHLDIKVDSAEFDKRSGLLYVSLRQTFSVWSIPLYKAPVRLVSVLQLTQRTPSALDSTPEATRKPDGMKQRKNICVKPKYYIASQEDLYPVTDRVQFLLPGLGPLLRLGWKCYCTWFFLLGSLIFFPLVIFLRMVRLTKRKVKPQKWFL